MSLNGVVRNTVQNHRAPVEPKGASQKFYSTMGLHNNVCHSHVPFPFIHIFRKMCQCMERLLVKIHLCMDNKLNNFICFYLYKYVLVHSQAKSLSTKLGRHS